MINMAKKYHTKVLSLLFIILLFGASSSIYAQDEYPREYTNPDEIIAFDKSTSYVEAIEVINQFLQEYQNKFIIDQSGTSGIIGVNLPAMHWEDALKYILRIKNLGLSEFDDYIEIVRATDLVPSSESGVTNASNPNSTQGEINLQTREVRINATFFEGNKRALQEIGIDWSTLTSNVPDNINDIVSGDGVDPTLVGPQGSAFGDQFVAVNSFNASSVSQNVFNALVNFGEVGPGIRVQALFSAFEADNMGEVLATPSVKVVDGQEGRIQVGQDFSIKQRDIAGNVTDQFFSTGTILTVTPRVIDTGDTTFIHLEIAVERSSASPDAVSTIINKQEATTQALLLDGEATSIAGLYRTEESQVRRGVPILKDLPPWFFGLRYLFGYNSNDYIENELIILVQAEMEQTLEERLAKKDFRSVRTLLSDTKQTHREGLDKVFTNPFAEVFPETDDLSLSAKNENQIEDDSTKEEDLAKNQTEFVKEEKTNPTSTAPEEEQEVLTDDQKKLAEELSMPIENPELMVVVPKAFSLNEYLNQKASGVTIEDEESETLKFFIIGGSFLVQTNADRFNKGLVESGYDTRVLFHPESRFNFVAYKGFAVFEEAVNYLKSVRADLNSEAWLFTKNVSK